MNELALVRHELIEAMTSKGDRGLARHGRHDKASHKRCVQRSRRGSVGSSRSLWVAGLSRSPRPVLVQCCQPLTRNALPAMCAVARDGLIVRVRVRVRVYSSLQNTSKEVLPQVVEQERP